MLKLVAACSVGALGVYASNTTTGTTTDSATNAPACVASAATNTTAAVTCAAGNVPAAAVKERARVTATIKMDLAAGGLAKITAKGEATIVANAMLLGNLFAVKQTVGTLFPAATKYCTDSIPSVETSTDMTLCFRREAKADLTPSTWQPVWTDAKQVFTDAVRRLEEADERQLSVPTAFSVKDEMSFGGQKSVINPSSTDLSGTAASKTNNFKMFLDDVADTAVTLATFQALVKTKVAANIAAATSGNTNAGLYGSVFGTTFTGLTAATVASSGNVTLSGTDMANPTVSITYWDPSTTSNAAAVTVGVMTLGAALLF